MRKSNLEKLREAKRQSFKQETLDGFDELVAFLVDGNRPKAERQVNPTQLAFIKDPYHSKAYKGAAGCAKTSTGVAEVLAHAIFEPGSKLFIARKDYNDLKGTTLLRAVEMLDMLPPGTLLDRNKEPPEKWVLKAVERTGPDGEVNDHPSTITFIGMSDELKGSYEFNGGFVDEADECSEKAVLGFLARCRWMGYGKLKPHRWISLAFNPPDINHWLYTACTGKNAQGEVVGEPKLKLFEPQPKENIRNLPADYYERLTASLPEDMRQRLVDNVWGSVFPGEPVIPQFKRSKHLVADLRFQANTLFRFWDFGFQRPACLFAQVTKSGRTEVLQELLGHNQTVQEFAAQVKAITASNYHTALEVVDYGDPAVKQQKDTGSALTQYAAQGIRIRYQYTPFDVSLKALRLHFERFMSDGRVALAIDSRKCPILTGGLAGGYHFKKDGVTPFKDGYYDHLVDTLRYGMYNLFGANVSTVDTSNLPTNIASVG